MTIFKNLLSPIKIGSLLLENRMVMAPMVTHLAAEDGQVTDPLLEYYRERAKGGIGLIITESNYVRLEGRGGKNRLGFFSKKHHNGHSRLVKAVHDEGKKICIQLHHAGRSASAKGIAQFPVAPTATDTARQLDISEIVEIEDAFAEAAARAKEIGFDALQIHGAHGYLINQFLSPLTNHRSDSYGVDFEGRVRFLLEIVRKVRQAVGVDFPVMVRLGGEETVSGGYGIDYIKEVAKRLEKAGVDSLDISGSVYPSPSSAGITPPSGYPDGVLIPLAAEVRKVVKIPVGTVGKIRDPLLAESTIENGKADFVLFGRTLVADPYFPEKVSTGKLEEIIRCVACNRCLDGVVILGRSISCTVNSRTGKEREYEIKPAVKRQKVAIVGGGPGGMEAATVAALRGHDVTLFEKSQSLGGLVRLAEMMPFCQELEEITRYQTTQLHKAGVKVLLETEATLPLLEKHKPDAIVLASGSSPILPDIPGIYLDNVCTAPEVIRNTTQVGQVVAIIGGGFIGAELAEYLTDQGKKVTIIKESAQITVHPEFYNIRLLIWRLNQKGVKVLINCKTKSISKNGVTIERLGQEEFIKADSVVIAKGMKSDRSLLNTLDQSKWKVSLVGDCVEPNRILEAVADGARVARQI